MLPCSRGIVLSTFALLLPLVIAPAAAPQERPSAKPFHQEEQVIAGSPKDSMEVRHLVLTGTNEEIGRALAELGRERYKTALRQSTDPVRTHALRRYIEQNDPILYARMRGVAAAFGQRIDDDAWDYTDLGFVDLHAGCSIVHLPPRATATGKSVVSRDYDYSTGSISFGFLPPGMLHPTARPYLLELHPDHGYASLAMTAYDLLSGAIDGINSEGLTVTMALDDELFTNYKMEPTLGPAVGLGELQTLRLLLDTCATAREAKEVLLQTKQYYQFVPVHYLIADRFGNSFVWEYSQAHNREYIVENPNRPLVMTNFSLNKHLNGDLPPSADQARSTCKRYALLTEVLGAGARISDDLLRQTHKRVDAVQPAPADPSRPPIRTFWHALYYPEERSVKISFYLRDEPGGGDAKAAQVTRSDYLEFHLAPTEFGKGSPPEVTPEPRPATIVPAAPQPVADKLKSGGAAVKLEGDRVVAVDLNKAADLAALLPLLHQLPALNELTMQSEAVDAAAMALLAGLPKLARLNLSTAPVNDAELSVLKTLPALRHLFIGHTKITDAGLARIAEMPQLETLGLRGDAITDEGLASLETMSNLSNLNLSETKVTDAGLAHLQHLARLEILLLSGDEITDAGLAHLEPLTGVTGLFLTSTKITDAGLAHLKRMSHLSKLGLSKTAVTDQGIAEARKYLPFWIKIEREPS